MNKQEYLLNCLSEECAEIIQAVSKIQRFGLHSDYVGKTNLDVLRSEIYDLRGVIAELDCSTEVGSFDTLGSSKAVADKQLKLRKYMEMSRELGLLTD